jgi:hypothetical protein
MKASRHKVVGYDGPNCPRCGRFTEIREHREIRPKQLKQPFYYARWFYCVNTDCQTTLIMQDQYRVWSKTWHKKKAWKKKRRQQEVKTSPLSFSPRLKKGDDIVMDVLRASSDEKAPWED